MIVIGLSGKARSGKDSTAKILKQKLESLDKKCLIVSYANYLKYLIATYFGGSYERTPENRTLWQWFGTEKVRAKNQNFWVNTVIDFVKIIEDDFDYIIIPDVRFQNELVRWSEEGFPIVSLHITRTNFENDLTPEQRNHASERALDGYQFNYYISAENISELEMRTDEFINELLGGK